MRQGWERIRLGEICGFVRGPFGGSLKKNCFKLDGYAVYEQQHAIYDQFDDVRYFINDDKFNEMKRFELNSGDLIMSCSGTMGKIAIVPENIKKGIINQALLKLSPSNKVSNNFLKLWMQSESFQDSLKEYSGGAAIQNVASVAILKNIEIPLPPLPEQQRIVSILDECYAAIAKAKANAEQNLKNAKELFESHLQFVFQNKGEDWEEKTVQEYVKEGLIFKPLDGNHGEIHPLKSDYVDYGVPFIMSRDMKDGIVDQENCKYISEKQACELRTGFSIKGDVLLSHKGTIGSVAILEVTNEFVILTPQITYYRIKNHSRLYNKFIYFYFLSSNFQKELNNIAQGGSTRAYIGITKQLSLMLVIPPLKEQQTIVQKLETLSIETKKLEAIYQQKINDLEELKKSILQKAFSGELKTAQEIAAA